MDLQFRHARQLVLVERIPHGEDHRDGLRDESARHERKHLRRGLVEPLRIVDDADQGSLVGHIGEQAQDGKTDEEAIRSVPGLQAECRAQRVALRRGKPLESVQHRRAELMQPGVRELHLGLDARRQRDTTA